MIKEDNSCIFSSPELKAHWWAYHMARENVCLSVSLLVCVSVCPHFQTSSPPEPLGRLSSNFMWSILGVGERKFVFFVQVTWPRWPNFPYGVKLKKNLLLRNRWADLDETWYVACGTWAHHSLYKLWPLDDLDLFYAKVKFGNLGISMGKNQNVEYLASRSK